jgi:hypothetical protein
LFGPFFNRFDVLFIQKPTQVEGFGMIWSEDKFYFNMFYTNILFNLNLI